MVQITMGSLDQTFNILSSLIIMQVLQRYPISSDSMTYLRIIYFIVISLQFMVFYYIKRIIETINDKRTFLIKDSDGNVQQSTFSSYDSDELNKLLKSSLFQIPIVLFLNIKMGMSQPLILQIITFIKNMLFLPLIHVYIFKERVFKIIRPFEETIVFSNTPEDEEEQKITDSDNQKVTEQKVTDTDQKVSEDKVTDSENQKVTDSDHKVSEKKVFDRKTEKIVEDDLEDDETLSSKKEEE
ncbi:inorganic phospphate transporter protein [Pseudoloma neurophilia]|uniref:Inorganic phospphate transporter protein n=1 Tax=Pseudoloma neurophilia TaxID=146866 RepID=A0A0R0LSB3_9MICR|nr:inorganic phospphate transporter protein [Pseudoloma neurophilia]